MKTKIHLQLWFLIMIIVISSCVPTGQLSLPDSAYTSVPATNTLAPTSTPTNTSTSVPKISPTPLPSPTPTAREYTIKSGDTMGGIAWTYNVSVDELIELNPEINPNLMIVGTKVFLPAATLPPANQTPQPTPIALPLEGLNCLTDADQGAWCFVWVNNNSSEAYENVSVSINLADLQASQVFSKQGTALLNVMESGERVPVAIYFPSPVPQPMQQSAQFVSAIPYNPESGRYYEVQPQVKFVDRKLNGSLFSISGTITIAQPVLNISIVAVALDDQSNIIGVRKWQSSFTEAVTDSEFQIELASVSGEISDYILFAEAQP